MKRMSSILRPVLGACALACLAALGVVLAACGGRQVASAESPPATLGTSAPVNPNARPAGRLPAVIYRGVTLSPPDRSKPVPLVIALHGAAATPLGFEGATLFSRAADRYGFVVAYLDSPLPFWKDPSNYTYISSMITQLTASENIAPRRVYIAGFSLGGYATYTAACQLSTQVAAIAVVSNVMSPLWHRPCPIARPVSELNILGSNDLVPVHPNSSLPLSADHTSADWRRLDGCSSQSRTTQVGPTTQTTWSNCIGGSEVGEYIVQGGIHTWPGSPGRTGADAQYDATSAILAFFGRHLASTTALSPGRYATWSKKNSRLFAKFVSVAARVSGRRRSVHVTIKLSASVRVLATITQHGLQILSRRTKLRKGNQVSLALDVPQTASADLYQLTLSFSGTSGAHVTIRRRIHVPVAPTK